MTVGPLYLQQYGMEQIGYWLKSYIEKVPVIIMYNGKKTSCIENYEIKENLKT